MFIGKISRLFFSTKITWVKLRENIISYKLFELIIKKCYKLIKISYKLMGN